MGGGAVLGIITALLDFCTVVGKIFSPLSFASFVYELSFITMLLS